MWFEILLIPFFLIVALFFVFWIVAEGSRWQKHRFLGAFARTIQASPLRAFLIFFILAILTIPSAMGFLLGFWVDAIEADQIPTNTTPVVGTLLITILVLSAMIPVVWSHFRVWRQAARSAAEVKVQASRE
ncbi:MAG: hypothetical protein C4K49_11440 [Candidatus Thorarchaeota archaeon]|nr:MAG: hypothetical protein C4K49_11440 [Candidatus Thorarchaeota archaeon]